MKYAYLALNLALIVFFAYIIASPGCNNPIQDGNKFNSKRYEIVKYVTDTQYVGKSVTIIKKGKDIYRDTVIYKPVPYLDSVQIDKILKEYYSSNVLSDTIKVDSGYVYITDTISKNTILSRKFTMDVKYPIITKETFYGEKKRVQVYIVAKGMVSQYGNFQNAGVGIMLKTKSDRMYGIGAGFDGARNLNITADIYIKL